MLGLTAALAFGTPAGAAAWSLSAAQRAAIERREIVVVADRTAATDGRGTVVARAAVRIAAAPDTVFAIMTDCLSATTWVPHLVSCRVLQSDPGTATDLIEHRVDYGWFVPRIDYVFRARHTDRRRIAFENVSGDLDENEGVWDLEPIADGQATIVTYTVRTRPKFKVPQWLYRRGVQAEIPGLLDALRKRAEQ